MARAAFAARIVCSHLVIRNEACPGHGVVMCCGCLCPMPWLWCCTDVVHFLEPGFNWLSRKRAWRLSWVQKDGRTWVAKQEVTLENLFDHVADPAFAALQQWEEGQVQLAIQRSLEDSEQQRLEREAGNELLDGRLRREGLRRVSVLADGNCQFHSVIQSGKLALSVAQLRQEVVKYLTPLGQLFREKLEERFQGKWSLYLNHIEKDGSWGDSLTLLALAHVLRRPIKVLTDSSAEERDKYILVVEPNDLVHPDTWEPEVFNYHIWSLVPWTNTLTQLLSDPLQDLLRGPHKSSWVRSRDTRALQVDCKHLQEIGAQPCQFRSITAICASTMVLNVELVVTIHVHPGCYKPKETICRVMWFVHPVWNRGRNYLSVTAPIDESRD